MTEIFQQLNKGPYAFFAFHDENNDQDLTMHGNMPTEGYGTSGSDDPYEKVSFLKAAKDVGLVEVKMNYLQ